MPEIVVKSRAGSDVVIAVQIEVADFESERFRARLLERLSRAVGHADAAEQAAGSPAAGRRGGATQLQASAETVIGMLGHGMALAEIEDLIERQPLGEEEKAALWLGAWSERSLTPRGGSPPLVE